MATGQRIKAARKNAKKTQAELGIELGVSASMVAQWENNLRNPKYETLQKIADALGIEPFDLLPDDLKEQFKSVTQYFSSTEEEERAFARETEKVLIQNVLNEELYEKLINITDAMHDAAMYGLSEISDDELAGVLIGSFNSLNKLGKREAVERVAELELIPKYQAQKPPETDE